MRSSYCPSQKKGSRCTNRISYDSYWQPKEITTSKLQREHWGWNCENSKRNMCNSPRKWSSFVIQLRIKNNQLLVRIRFHYLLYVLNGNNEIGVSFKFPFPTIPMIFPSESKYLIEQLIEAQFGLVWLG